MWSHSEICDGMVNSVDPDQTAALEAGWLKSSLHKVVFLSI